MYIGHNFQSTGVTCSYISQYNVTGYVRYEREKDGAKSDGRTLRNVVNDGTDFKSKWEYGSIRNSVRSV